MKYRKKPIVIEAIRWRGNNLEEVMKFINSEFTFEKDIIYFTKKFSYDGIDLYIDTLEGKMKVSQNDYIIKGIKGEFYPCKPDIFDKTYEVVLEND